MKKNNIIKYVRRRSPLTHFLPALQLSASLIKVTPLHFKLEFSLGKLMELR